MEIGNINNLTKHQLIFIKMLLMRRCSKYFIVSKYLACVITFLDKQCPLNFHVACQNKKLTLSEHFNVCLQAVCPKKNSMTTIADK